MADLLLAIAVNPKMFGVTDNEWDTIYAFASLDKLFWCRKTLTVTFGSNSFTALIVDTCQVTDTGDYPKCNYEVISDFYSLKGNGKKYLSDISGGDDFYIAKNVKWTLNK